VTDPGSSRRAGGASPPYWQQHKGACLHFSLDFSTMDEAFVLF
jgi:hypothetical protein